MQWPWIIVGGADKGGIIVRAGVAVSSAKEDERLGYGALVQKLGLMGDRLHYKLISGSGPKDGWISTRLATKALAVPCYPQWVTRPGGLPPADSCLEHGLAMTFYAISDVHVELSQNMKWLKELPRFEKSTIIVAGDIGVQISQIKQALQLFQHKFDNVFYCFGNHETWVHKSIDVEQTESFVKLREIREVCRDLGVFTTPQIIEGVWVVPVLGWYHTCWDIEPPLQPPPGKKLKREPPAGPLIATDTGLCRWGDFKNGSTELAQELDKQNEDWGIWPLPAELVENLKAPIGRRTQPIISFSHFLPHIDLMPEKRFLFQPNLTQIVGSDFIRKRLEQLSPDLHIFGHSHFPWDMTLGDGVRYRSWPLGTPAEQARRIASYPTEHVEQWHPLRVFDSEGRHYSGDESCWFSMMYSRIGREPWSCHMANYVRVSYCPDAPEVPASIISPGGLLEVESAADSERRDAYMGESTSSTNRQIASVGDADGMKGQ